MILKIKAFESSRQKSIEKACCEEWPFEPEAFSVEKNGDNLPVLTARAADRLCGGETEEDFADRIADAVWKANQGYAEVNVIATYLEDLPYEIHERRYQDYMKWKKKAA